MAIKERPIIFSSPMTSRAIKEHLGDDNDEYWTAEAIDNLTGEIESLGVLVVRYKIAQPPKPMESIHYNNRQVTK